MAESSAERIREIEAGHFWFSGRDRLLERLFAERGLSSPVLDLGCGTGRYARRLTTEGTWCAGVDAAPLFSSEGNGPFVAGLAEQLPFRSEAFATVLARDVLEHVEDLAALDEAARVLRPGGILVVLVPAWPSLWGTRDVRAGHRRRYTRRSLRRVVCRCGFDVEELHGYQFLLLPVVVVSRFADRVLRDSGGSAAGSAGSTIEMEDRPSGWINRLFGLVTSFELWLGRRAGLRPPTGSSLVLVAVRR